MDEFPPNSKKERESAPKNVKRVTSATTVRRRKPLGKSFSHVFMGGDAKSALSYALVDVMLPALKDGIVDTLQSGVERLFYGDNRPRRYRSSSGPVAGPGGYVAYNRSPTQRDDRPPLPRMLSRASRTRHNFDDIVISSRQEAEEVLDQMYTIISKYDSVTIADLYELTGLESSHTDHKWGWTDLRGARVGRVRSGGYLLELPEPEFFE